MIKPFGLALLVISLSAPAAAEAPAMLLFRQVTPPQLWIYDADSCEEETAAECTLVSLQCSSIGSLTVTVNGLFEDELSQWMDSGGTLTVAGIPGLSSLAADRSTATDMDGLWSVKFTSSYERPKTEEETEAPELSFDIVYGQVAIPLDDPSTRILRAFLSGCGDGTSSSG